MRSRAKDPLIFLCASEIMKGYNNLIKSTIVKQLIGRYFKAYKTTHLLLRHCAGIALASSLLASFPFREM